MVNVDHSIPFRFIPIRMGIDNKKMHKIKEELGTGFKSQYACSRIHHPHSIISRGHGHGGAMSIAHQSSQAFALLFVRTLPMSHLAFGPAVPHQHTPTAFLEFLRLCPILMNAIGSHAHLHHTLIHPKIILACRSSLSSVHHRRRSKAM